MTTEDDFQGALDANPADWQTRLVFADWLDEHGDPRAAGYRALGTLGLRPHTGLYGWTRDTNPYITGVSDRDPHKGKVLNWLGAGAPDHPYRTAGLPEDWYCALPHPNATPNYAWLEDFKSRRDSEDAAAMAFSKLSADRRAAILSGATK